MNRITPRLALLLVHSAAFAVAAPAPEAFLPVDTLAVISIPDADLLRTELTNSPWGKLWRDPAVRDFRNHLFPPKPTNDNSNPGAAARIEPASLAGSTHGQFTVALARNGWHPGGTNIPTAILVVDGREDGPALRRWLAGFRAWLETNAVEIAGCQLRGNDFMVARIPISRTPAWLGTGLSTLGFGLLETGDAPAATSTNAAALELLAGQVGNLVLAGTDARVLEEVLDRLTGKGTNDTSSAFAQFAATSTDDAKAYGWIDLRPWMEGLQRWANAEDARTNRTEPDSPMPKRTTLLRAAGLAALSQASWVVRLAPKGGHLELRLGAPVQARNGFLKMIEIESGDSSPPDFVPASVTHFERVRLDLRKTWHTLERMVTEVFPQAAGVMDMLFETAPQPDGGDLKSGLLAGLGNDLVRFELPPHTNTLAALTAPPSAYFLGSTNAARLLETLKALAVFLPPPMTAVSATNQAGTPIFSLRLPARGTDGPTAADRHVVSLAARPDGVVISTDEMLLGELLTTNMTVGAPLRGLPDLGSAAEQVGGMTNGLFGYRNLQESVRWMVETLRTETNAVSQLLASTPLAAPGREAADRLDQRLNLGLLPPYDRIRSYFHFLVYSATVDADGFVVRVFAPHPPDSR